MPLVSWTKLNQTVKVRKLSCDISNYCCIHILSSCASAAVCEWRVTYSSKQVCGLKGASVVLPCRYHYPWHDTYQKGQWTYKHKRTVKVYTSLEYPDCSLNLDKLLDNQAGVYKFQFYTALHFSWITNLSGVVLSVTGNLWLIWPFHYPFKPSIKS